MRRDDDNGSVRRLLMVANPFPPQVSGGNARLLRFVRYLPEYGWEVTVLAADVPGTAPVPPDLHIERAAAPGPEDAYRFARRLTRGSVVPFRRAPVSVPDSGAPKESPRRAPDADSADARSFRIGCRTIRRHTAPFQPARRRERLDRRARRVRGLDRPGGASRPQTAAGAPLPCDPLELPQAERRARRLDPRTTDRAAVDRRLPGPVGDPPSPPVSDARPSRHTLRARGLGPAPGRGRDGDEPADRRLVARQVPRPERPRLRPAERLRPPRAPRQRPAARARPVARPHRQALRPRRAAL